MPNRITTKKVVVVVKPRPTEKKTPALVVPKNGPRPSVRVTEKPAHFRPNTGNGTKI
ncbi:uncharacterized protein H6S33_010925 [Morchella sextelata]|uniref:uncharacterized protein n=1 Tax=Morchella sextelata TaxID=1174677 RepID=UPI001D059FC1|nr:uncharacterized protein H6S33_010925 [Morchella sextelata]KAH0611660.1 hypothetical protein H6S33_010925 [Morchella sextelata]